MKIPQLSRKQMYWAAAAVLLVIILLGIVWYWPSSAVPPLSKTGRGAPFFEADTVWVNKQLAGMTTEEKVGQLLMFCTSKEAQSEDSQLDPSVFSEVQPGGICLGPGSLKMQLLQVEGIKKILKTSPIIGAAAEFGLLFPSDTLASYPVLPSVSAISDDSVIVRLAESVARQMKAAGVQINFAPDMEMIVKNGDDSREISYKMFLKEHSRKAALYMRKQQQWGILVCAGNFPNYHLEGGPAPGNDFDSVRIRPYRDLFLEGLSGICVSHYPQQMSDSVKVTIIDSLQQRLKFPGLVISDFSNRKRRVSGETPGMAELAALNAGSDMIKVGTEIKSIYDFILDAVNKEQLTEAALNLKVKKILLAKCWTGLQQKLPALNDTLYRDLPWRDAEVAAREAIASSLVLLANKKSGLPLSDLAGMKAATLSITSNRRSGFTSGFDHYASATHFMLSPQASEEALAAMKKSLAPYTTIIVAVYADPRLALRGKEINDFLHALEAGKRLIVVHFGPSESLALLDRYPLMIHSFGKDAISESLAAQAIFGGVPLPARLPMTCSQVFCYGDGIPVKRQTRVKYGLPEEVGVSSIVTSRMDSLIRTAINAGAFPGCQVYVACKGQVIVNKGWGYHTYRHENEVRTSDLYDLASVTKVAAATIAMMSLYDAGRIKLDTTLNYYFKDLDKNSHNKKVRDSKLNYITLRQLMTHCSGLPAALPIARFISPRWYLKYMLELERKRMEEESSDTLVAEEQSPEWMIDTSQLMMDEDSIFDWMFVREKDKEHKIQIGEDFFMRTEVVDSIWQLSKQTAVRKSKSYLYSDMNFYLVMKVVEMVSKMSIDRYMTEKIYRPMNLGRICYNPRKSFNKKQIVPTEEEKIFRKQLLEGFVHDPTAALLGGVSGNAGLFSNAENLGILMQMLMNGGTYGGRRYMSEKTVQLFTSVQAGGYRGLGWDHQTKSGMKMVAPSASPATYGHTGFTGTCVWVDPVNEVVFVFLSNRVHPKNTNQKINGMRVRQKLQQFVYDAIMISSKMPASKI